MNEKEMNYVEVVYMNKNKYLSRKTMWYEPNQAHKIYLKTIDKFMRETKDVIVCIRDQDHILIKSYRNY
jgi:hypothetical protein